MRILKKIIFFKLFLLTIIINGQEYGNEWINYNQQYFHFPVVKTGVHRIYYSTINDILSEQGVDLSQINHTQFQIFGKQKEISLLVNDINNNNILDGNEYIEFYAGKNDGWLDELVYDSVNHIPDKFFSLFNDTIRYYFSWNNGFNNKRTLLETDVNYDNYSSIEYCWKKTMKKYTSNYVLGEQSSGISSPKYNIGEGWAGSQHSKTGSYPENLNTINFFSSGPNSHGEINISSTNSSSSNQENFNHNTQFYVNNNLIFDSSYFGYKVLNIEFDLNNNNLNNSTTIEHYISDIGQGTDHQHISSIVLFYPHNTNFNDYSDLHFGLNINQKKRLTIDNMISEANNPILYMLDDINRKIPLIINGSKWEAVIPPSSSDTNLLYLFNQDSVIEITSLEAVNQNGFFTDFNSLQLDSAFVIITHQKLLTSAREYANYRSELYDTIVVDINELYHQYSSGIFKNPLSIRRFVKFLMDKWPSWPSHIFLIGSI